MDKKYFNTVYDKFWEKQTQLYGFGKYEKYIAYVIKKSNPKRVFEVGIGNGWPIGVTLSHKGISVSGCDISERLVEQARVNLNNQDGIWVGELGDYTGNEKYDVVYCVRTSWYIKNFDKLLEKMFSMTDSNGYVIFDIMESQSIYFLKLLYRWGKAKILQIIGLDVEGEQKLFFYSRYKIEHILRKRNIKFYSYNERTITRSRDYANTPKRIYVCSLKGEGCQ